MSDLIVTQTGKGRNAEICYNSVRVRGSCLTEQELQDQILSMTKRMIMLDELLYCGSRSLKLTVV